MTTDYPSSPLCEELSAITSYITAARAIVHDGYMPDMSAIEKRISDACLSLQAAEQNEQSRCLPMLAALLKSLDDCERDMRAWKDKKKATGSE